MQTKSFWLNTGIIALIAVFLTSLKTEAQVQSSLVNQPCQSATTGMALRNVLGTDSDYSASIGREVLPVVGFLYASERFLSGAYISVGRPAEIICPLNSSRSRFTQMNLVFGIDRSNSYALPESKLLFTVYLDDNSAGTKEVVIGTKQSWNLNIQGVKNVALRVECQRGKCPPLAFTEMSLR